jgi:hypothetical protein
MTQGKKQEELYETEERTKGKNKNFREKNRKKQLKLILKSRLNRLYYA